MEPPKVSEENRRALWQRFRPLIWLGACFLLIQLVIRIVLLVAARTDVSAGSWPRVFGLGLGYDLIVFLYLAWPVLLYLWLVPRRVYLTAVQRWLTIIFSFAWLYTLMFIALSEWTFWGEFATRFNFIAVDYLIYTTEVVGNIRESYPVVRWMTELAIVALVVVWFTRRALAPRDDGSRFGARSLVVLAWLVATVAVSFGVTSAVKNTSGNAYVDALSGNGIYEFVAAFRNSRLDYPHFYKTLPDAEVAATLRQQLKTPDAEFVSSDPNDITRKITHEGPEKHLNVVLISVESLSGEYLRSLGGTRDVSPNLDALSSQSLFFTNLYANGTRTVRGLEALTLSVPPTPGDSLVKQKGNENLHSLADIFNERGYESKFVYGGYGYFDNMNYFFANNGYGVADRTAIGKDITIHSENVWGVADEDLYTLALQQMDKAQADGKPFFLHIMTTSNHRPFTYPEGRVQGKQGTRTGALRYNDWAIADFIKRARAKPYFDDTVFVITADHCAASAGKSSIPVNRYHIPLLIYAPKWITPRHEDRLMSQIDIGPTLLGLLNFSYTSHFFGYDLMALEPGRERAFPSTYQKLGYIHGDRMTVLSTQQSVEQVNPDFRTGEATPVQAVNQEDVTNAIAAYQGAAEMFKDGRMRHKP